MSRVTVTLAALTALALAACLPTVAEGANAPKAAVRTSTSYVRGMNSYVAVNCQTPTEWSTDATNQMAAFKSLGANAVDLVFPLYTESHTSDSIFARQQCGSIYQSPTPAQLATVVQIAHSAGLSVFIRPTLDQTVLEEESPSFWHGNIKPKSVSAWFTNYRATLEPYLSMAQTNHVEDFAISDEYTSLALEKEWPSLITYAKGIYHGNLIFTASWATGGNMEWYTGTTLGVDTYRPLGTDGITASPAQLLSGWNAVLKKIPVPKIKNTAIDEIGIPAQDGAYSDPNGVNFSLKGHPFNQMIQVNWFTMACSFVQAHAMTGIYFWGSIMTDNDGKLLKSPDSHETSFIQPDTQIAIKNCFGTGTAPSVTKLTPASGATGGGTKVTVTGANFIGAISVTVGSTSVAFTVVKGSELTLRAPRGKKGEAKVTITTGAGPNAATTAAQFTYK